MLLSSEELAGLSVVPLEMKKIQFLKDVLQGLRSQPKKLDSKYFYDESGDLLFQKIMNCREYYVTRCEAEIFEVDATEIASTLQTGFEEFDLIELGAGDATKTIRLLKELKDAKCSFRYLPIDISGSIIQYLEKELPVKLPDLIVNGLHGEYIQMLGEAASVSSRKKVVVFLGSNIGNMDTKEALAFLKQVRSCLNKSDRILVGFDLKKDPGVVLAAYNDSEGHTSAFNLNLLERINRELGADFCPSNFYRFPTYDPGSGACKSYLVSKHEQEVCIENELFHFEKGETIYMELSQKYDLQEIRGLAEASGFSPLAVFQDRQKWFVDAIWECV